MLKTLNPPTGVELYENVAVNMLEFPPMNNDSTSSSEKTGSNKKLLFWFLLAVLIALLPWLVLS